MARDFFDPSRVMRILGLGGKAGRVALVSSTGIRTHSHVNGMRELRVLADEGTVVMKNQ